MTLFLQNNLSILFLHVPKCGGSSIDRLFKNNGYSSTLEMRGLPPQACLTASPQHQTCEKLKSILNTKELSDIFIMTRDPYERIISEYNWQFREKDHCDKPELNQWIIDSLNKASQNKNYSDNHFRQSIDFIDEAVPCKIFKLEEGIEFVEEFFIRKQGSLEVIEIPNEKRAEGYLDSNREPELSSEAIQAINHFYEYDFKAFGYKPRGTQDSIFENEIQSLQSNKSNEMESKVKAIIEWREQTINALYLKLLKELKTLYEQARIISHDIHEKDSTKDLEAKEAQQSVNTIYDEILLNLKRNELCLNLQISSQHRAIQASNISGIIELIDQYRCLLRRNTLG